jgi:rubredoxin
MRLQEAELVDMEQKFFACPECGKQYKVRFNGGRYQCKQCRFIFDVPRNDAGSQGRKHGAANRLIKGLMLMVAVLFIINSVEAFLLFRFYRRVQPLVKTADEAVKFMKEISDKFD